MAKDVMTEEVAERRAAALEAWTLDASGDPLKLRSSRKLPNFRAALAWVNRVGMLAEEHEHHPDFHLTGWNQVELVLWSHDAGGLTERDFRFAEEVERLAAK